MAFYHDYKTGKRIEVTGPLVREDAESAWLGFILVVAILIGAGALTYRYAGANDNQQMAQTTTEQSIGSFRP
jgi:hypothetical protein